MSIMFQGGPLDGQTGGPPEPAGFGGESPFGGEPAPEEELDEAGRLDRILSDARTVLEMGGLSEKSKLLIEKATTLFQQIKAEEEKEGQDAMSGKLSPRLINQAYGGGQ